MSIEPSRTQLFESHEEMILTLRHKAVDSMTLSRAYNDLAESIGAIQTRGRIWDLAQADLSAVAFERARKCMRTATKFNDEADILTERGID